MSTRTSRCMHMFIYVHIYNIWCLNMSYSISVSDKEMGGGGRLLLLLPIFFAKGLLSSTSHMHLSCEASPPLPYPNAPSHLN